MLVTAALLLAACGGGDSSTTTVSGQGLNSLGLSPAVSTAAFVQRDNNLVVQVEQGPGFGINPNILYATVKLCYPGDATRCAVIDHVLVDTGSVGLRVLASKLEEAKLQLPPVQLSTDPAPVQNAWECMAFVAGGVWGSIVAADVVLGPQATVGNAISVQKIDDLGVLKPTASCNAVTDSDPKATPPISNILNSVSSLGANGILGIGSTNLDCGPNCTNGYYSRDNAGNATGSGSSLLYYQCPQGTTDPANCTLSSVPYNLQVFNPISALAPDFSGGVVLAMPAIPATQPGAATATGELILGLGTRSNNMAPATRVMLGVGISPNPDSFLAITTQYNGSTYYNSYLDTGTNMLYFYDKALTPCTRPPFYCPKTNLDLQAILSDGDDPSLDQVTVSFRVGNYEALTSTSNMAFNNLGAYASDSQTKDPVSTSFAWGMPFFYGKRVYLSIWDIASSSSTNFPWYAWEPL